MHIDSFINHEIPCLNGHSTIKEALDLMKEFFVSELPLVIDEKVATIVDEEVLLDSADDTELIVKMIGMPSAPAVLSQAHPYEAACRMAEFKLSLLPVIDDQENYLGLVTRHELFQYFFEPTTGLAFPGAIIVLSMKPSDYSLSEIARICESSDTTILNVQTFSKPNTEELEVVLKTNKKDLQSLKAAFDRFEYNIKEVFGFHPDDNNLIERYRLLMNYINM